MATDISPKEQLLTLTREMFERATAGEWDQLTTLERTRLPLLNKFIAQGIPGNVEFAKEVLAMDEKTKKLAEAQMPILQEEIQKMKNSGKASNAYQAVQNATPSQD